MFIDSSAKRLLLALMWFGVAIGTSGLLRPMSGSAGLNAQPPSLQLTTTILGEEYCVGDSELDGLRLKLRLTYTNKSKQNLLLFKGSRLVSRIMISRDF